MATLTETAYYSRQSVKFGIIGFIAIIIFWQLWNRFYAWWLIVHPPPPPPPNYAFGKLPAVDFLSEGLINASSSTTINYQLETVEVGLPKFSSVGPVYFMPKKSSGLLDIQRTREMAAKLGFAEENRLPQKTLHLFTDTENSLRSLSIEESSLNFDLKYDYLIDPAIFSNPELPSKNAAAEELRAYLAGLNLLPKDLEEGQAETTYLRWTGNSLEPTLSGTEANAIKITLRRNNINKEKVISPKGLITAILCPSVEKNKRFLEINYHYWPIDTEIIGTYPLKTSEEALTELKAGQAFLIVPPESQNITIRKVSLVFFDARAPQLYLQPVFVFEGTDGTQNFTAFLPAVKEK